MGVAEGKRKRACIIRGGGDAYWPQGVRKREGILGTYEESGGGRKHSATC